MNKKHLAAAFAVFAATTMSFSAFAASIDANARAYERAAAEQYTYARTSSGYTSLPIWLRNNVHHALVTNHCQRSLHSR